LAELAIAFDLDVVLGAFAAGFVLRGALPEGDESLEHKLEGLAFGLLIPIFFVTWAWRSILQRLPITRSGC
jgi:Kef-type K+ transport system membrane component KefB